MSLQTQLESEKNLQLPADSYLIAGRSISLEDDYSDDLVETPDRRSGRRKIKIEYISDKSRRHITFSKRKAGIMKKAYELSTLTGTQILLLVVSETGLVYTFTTSKLQPLVTKSEGKSLIQACLNSTETQDQSPQTNQTSSTSTSQYRANQFCREKLPVGQDKKFHSMNEGGVVSGGGLVASEASFNAPPRQFQQKPGADSYHVAGRQEAHYSMPHSLYATNLS
ncbi:hypothetical protein INT43_002157 [Umbelopsis isabellina]|uniref:MADS-box domain-containing protein n=1 Tax=Mortierella isabellina TaxID=91625 RepID=A0A8H7UL34_MORIS|nr:hypothetical protein INT43_002157 [Umbelopsis isabellina]